MIASAQSSLSNAARLLDDADYLAFGEPPTTAQFLVAIAQEEIAKAFLLALVVRRAIPWDQRLLRATRDHTCKQLLNLVLEYLSPDIEEFLERCNATVLRNEIREVPQHVLDAISIFRYEKIGRWAERQRGSADEAVYEVAVLAVAQGKVDRQKQDALYVRLGRDGSVASIPSGGTYDTVQAERDRARRMSQVTQDILGGEPYPALDYDKIEKACMHSKL